jgi:hypothetical protein
MYPSLLGFLAFISSAVTLTIVDFKSLPPVGVGKLLREESCLLGPLELSPVFALAQSPQVSHIALTRWASSAHFLFTPLARA